MLFWGCMLLHAQKNMDDVIYLKNGSKITGTIQQLFPDSIVRFKQSDGSIWVFKMAEVEMIDKEVKNKYQTNIANAKGYRLGIDAGFLIGAGNSESKAPLSFQMLHSYHFAKLNAVGIGAGFEFFHLPRVPVFVDFHHYFNLNLYSPFVFVQGGGSLPLGKYEIDNYGYNYTGKIGWLANTGVGILFPINDRASFSISLSYRYQNLEYKRDYAALPDMTRIEKMNRFNLRFGLVLH